MLPLLTEYKTHLLLGGRSPLSVYNVERNLIYFFRFLGHEDARKVTGEVIERYKHYVIAEYPNKGAKGLSSSAIEARLYTLSSYFKFLIRNKYMSSDPTSNLIVPKGSRKYPEYIPTEEEVKELLSKPNVKRYRGIRDRALLELLYTCHLRNVQVRKLTLQDVDMKNKLIYPSNNRGEKGCGVPITDSVRDLLKKYLKVSRPRLARQSEELTDALFLTQYGEPYAYGTINEMLGRYRGNKPISSRSIMLAGVSRRLSCGKENC